MLKNFFITTTSKRVDSIAIPAESFPRFLNCFIVPNISMTTSPWKNSINLVKIATPTFFFFPTMAVSIINHGGRAFSQCSFILPSSSRFRFIFSPPVFLIVSLNEVVECAKCMSLCLTQEAISQRKRCLSEFCNLDIK